MLRSTNRAIIATLIVWSIGVALVAAPIDVERLSPPKLTAAGELVTHVFSIRNTDPEPIDVDVRVELPTGWRALGVPPSLRIGAHDESFVFVTISVPPAALASDYEPVLAVAIGGSILESDCLRVAAPIRVLPATELSLESTDVTLLPGDTASSEIRVTNLGNVQEQIELVLSPPSGIHIEWSPAVVALSPREVLPVEVVVRVDASTGPARFLVPILARSTIHDGTVAQGFVEVAVLPPDPSRVPSTVATVFPIEVIIDSTQAFPPPLTTPMPRASLSVQGEKIVADNDFAFRLHLESLFGPQPLSVSSFLIAYETPSVSMKVGDVSTSLTTLLSATITGARLSISTPLLAALAVVGGKPTEATAGGAATFGAEQLRAGIGYLERRTVVSQASSVALYVQGFGLDCAQRVGTSISEGLSEWSFELEGALGQDNGTGSWAGIGNVRCDIGESFMVFDAFRVGGAFPFGLADRVGYGLSQRYRDDAFSLGTSFSHERSNVERDPTRMTGVSDRLGLTLDIGLPDSLPEITAIADLERERMIESDEDSIRSSYAITIKQSKTSFPFRSFARITDRWNRPFDHRLREWKLIQEFGVAFDDWIITLMAEFETIVDRRTAERLDGTSRLSLLVESLDSTLGGTLLAAATEDDRDLTLSLHYASDGALDIAFDVGIAWDREGLSVPTWSLGLKIATRFDLPLPFALDSGQIEGRAFIDYNGNGVFDLALEEGDLPLGSLLVSLRDEEQLVSTDAAGLFRFAPLPAQSYVVTLAEPVAGAVLDAPVEVVLVAGEHRFVNLALRPSLRILGAVLEVEAEPDEEDDGLTSGRSQNQGRSEAATETAARSGIQGVRITLASEEGTLLETVTSVSGAYEFMALEPGTYAVTVDRATLPARFEFTTQDSIIVTLQRDAAAAVDFAGFIRPRQLVLTFQPPFADFTSSPDPATTASAVLFDGGWSFDFDGEIVAYEWDLDGDGATDALGATTEYRFNAPGEYPITLTVIDNDGASDSVTVMLSVE
ncbi:PKD domain-containing protein [Candidatus Bipolaricaulota bacterium]|nr:PKD domain-containing protein [Candidatus Bipolaricaulota bacterium]